MFLGMVVCVYDAVDHVVADGDEADGDIRISGIKTT